MKVMNLGELVHLLGDGKQYHICIHDLSGLLEYESYQIGSPYEYHSRDICNAAKTTSKGMQLCLACKYLALEKAIETKESYHGACPLGVYEVVTPVVIEGKVVCVIFIGNLHYRQRDLAKDIHRTVKFTKVDEHLLLEEAKHLCPVEHLEPLTQMAELISSYICLLYQTIRIKVHPDTHWAVEALKKYIAQYYDKDLKLSHLARLYYLNETYLGRLFKQQEGTTFTNYLNNIRVETACKMLKMTDNSILSISMAVGFNNVTYFNRVFKKQTGMTPAEYRKTD